MKDYYDTEGPMKHYLAMQSLNRLSNMYCDTDGIIKLKEVNKMKDWLVVHDMSGEVVMIKKSSIEFISRGSDGSAYLSTRSGSLSVKENYNDVVRRILNEE